MDIFNTLFNISERGNDPAKSYDPKVGRDLANALMPFFETYFRVQYKGLDNLPTRTFIGVGTHGGGFWIPDSLIWVGKYLTMNREPNLLTLVHSFMKTFSPAIVRFFKRLGLYAANQHTARLALEEGFAIQVYPGGELDVWRSFFDRNKVNFYGRTGFIKLAIETQTPLVPVVSIGAHETYFVLWDGKPIAQKLYLDKLLKTHVFPLTWSYPNGFSLGLFQKLHLPLPSQITISVLPPIQVDCFEPKDSKNEKLVKALYHEITHRMQIEMDILAKNRIPIIGKI